MHNVYDFLRKAQFFHKMAISQFSRVCSHYDVIVKLYINGSMDGTYFGITASQLAKMKNGIPDMSLPWNLQEWSSWS